MTRASVGAVVVVVVVVVIIVSPLSSWVALPVNRGPAMMGTSKQARAGE